MKFSHETKKYVETIAAEALNAFERVSTAAKQRLHVPPTPASNAFASINTLTSAAAMREYDEISRASREAREILSREPAVARVIAEDDQGQLRTIYICRTTPIQVIHQFASYRAPLGRLASLRIGSSITLPNGKHFKLLQKALLFPTELKEGWDSEDTILTSEDIRTLTVESLRAVLITTADVPEQDLVEQLLAVERLQMNVIEGVRRRVITKMTLRDQPVLDQFQDEIFRLPLSHRLLILGPAGTGKTTTLIKRLGQKLDQDVLDEDDKELVATISQSTTTPHSKSWEMFTPTELLKQYLKEAFAKEGIAASDQRIKTWIEMRHDLARNIFGVLRSGSGSGSLVMKESLPSITQSALENSTHWFDDFDRWQRSAFLDRLNNSGRALKEDPDAHIAKLGARLFAIVEHSRPEAIASTFDDLSQSIELTRNALGQLRQRSDAILRGESNRQLNRDRDFLAKLFDFIKDLKSTESEDDLDELEADEDEETAKPRSDTAMALSAYMAAVRAVARGTVTHRMPKKNSGNARVVDWLGSRSMSDAQLRELGTILVPQSHLRAFVSPVKRYLDSISSRYRAFRRIRRDGSSWYTHAEIANIDLHPLEVDIILLAILKSAGELLSRSHVLRGIDSPTWTHLQNVLDQYRTQILVDEATDFSPVQLACMYSLSHPRGHSFFACGDFNQRLTTWGTRTSDEMRWVCADLMTRKVSVAYRQTRQLNDFSSAIIDLTGGIKREVTLPPDIDNNGVAPALLENSTAESHINWLARRIIEIETLVRQFPSIAIFVPSEAQVQPVAQALNRALEEQNFRVVPCPNGQVVGHQTEIRVFDVQHIKGLEFEAVFFVDLDTLADDRADLFPGYLYVGSTRAATYLGVTCRKTLPSILNPIRDTFVPGWQS
jgi:DNA polymerase III delta prime subunit